MLPETEHLADSLKEEYEVPVIPMNIDTMNEKDIYYILKEALYEFPIIEVKVNIPEWIAILNSNNEIKKNYIDSIKESVLEVDKLKDIEKITKSFQDNKYIERAYIAEVDPSTGIVTINIDAPNELYNETLKDIIKIDVTNKAQLLKLFQEYDEAKTEYEEIKYALKMVKQTGYGVASPSLKDMKLDTPEIIKQGNRFGVKLKAVAPSIHMIRVDVNSTFEPIIGSELQSKELINYLMKYYEINPQNIWKSEIFGRSLDVIVQEGIQSKISLMPENIRYKLSQTLSKIVNKGSNNLIAIVI
jgi:stage IV sporulation protein A